MFNRTIAVACALSALLLASACGGTELEEDRASIKASPDPTAVTVAVADPCPSSQVTFNGKCRSLDFFTKLVTPDATLLGVVGPTSKSQDTGAIVLEGFGNGVIRALSVLPTKMPPTGPRIATRIYHADYPITKITSIQGFVDNEGYGNVFAAELGPLFGPQSGFGLVSWTLRTDTASGYRETYSNGTELLVIASSTGESNYCDSAAAAAGTFSTASCLGGVAIDSFSAGAAGGVMTLLLSDGAGGGAAAGVAATVFGGVATIGSALCSSLGNLSSAVVGDACRAGGPSNDLDDLHFLPYLPEVPATPVAGMCPAGTILYSGQIVTCEDTQFVTYSDGEVLVEAGELCDTTMVYNVCAVP